MPQPRLSIGRTKMGSGNERWQTSPKLFAAIEQQFGPFDVDLTADADNHLLPCYFGPGSAVATDALAATLWWSRHGRCGYSNPPFDNVFMRAMFKKAAQEAMRDFETTLLVPFRATTVQAGPLAFPDVCCCYLCDGRITFFEDGAPRFDDKGRPMSAFFDCCLLHFSADYRSYKGSGSHNLRTFHVPQHVW